MTGQERALQLMKDVEHIASPSLRTSATICGVLMILVRQLDDVTNQLRNLDHAIRDSRS